MVYRVDLARNAEAELEQLYLWVVERAPQQGSSWFNGLERAILTLDQPDNLIEPRLDCVRQGGSSSVPLQSSSRALPARRERCELQMRLPANALDRDRTVR